MQEEKRQFIKYPFLTRVGEDLVIIEANYDGPVPLETARDLNGIIRNWASAGRFYPNGDPLDAYSRVFEHLEGVITNKLPTMETPPTNPRHYLRKAIINKLLDVIDETVEETRENHDQLKNAEWDPDTSELDAVDEKTRVLTEGRKEAIAHLNEIWPFLSKRSRQMLKIFLIVESKAGSAKVCSIPWSTFNDHLNKAMAEFRKWDLRLKKGAKVKWN